MKKELVIHFLFAISFGIFISLIRGWIGLAYWPFWLGIIFGTLLPNVDYFVYAFFLRPQEFMSQKTAFLVKERNFRKTFDYLAATARGGGAKLIFHTAYFQVIFMILTFWVVTSSGSLFGIGLVTAFFLHLIVDQMVDLSEKGSIEDWFKDIPVEVDKEKTIIYFVAMTVLLLVFSFLL